MMENGQKIFFKSTTMSESPFQVEINLSLP